jgi:hypothetical protein
VDMVREAEERVRKMEEGEEIKEAGERKGSMTAEIVEE